MRMEVKNSECDNVGGRMITFGFVDWEAELV